MHPNLQCTAPHCHFCLQKAVVEIQTLNEQGQATPAGSLQVVVTNNKGKTVAQIDPLHGTQGMYRLDILQHVDSAGQYK